MSVYMYQNNSLTTEPIWFSITISFSRVRWKFLTTLGGGYHHPLKINSIAHRKNKKVFTCLSHHIKTQNIWRPISRFQVLKTVYLYPDRNTPCYFYRRDTSLINCDWKLVTSTIWASSKVISCSSLSTTVTFFNTFLVTSGPTKN